MQENELLELWTRMLEGESLNGDESAALDGFLLSTDQQTKTRLQKDLQQSQALQAVYSSSASDASFAERVLDQIKQESLAKPEPPPIVTPARTTQEIVVTPAERKAKTANTNIWIVVACTVLLLCGVSFLLSTGDEGGAGKNEPERIATAPKVDSPIDRPNIVDPPRESLAEAPDDHPNELVVPEIPTEVDAPSSVVNQQSVKVVQNQPKSDTSPEAPVRLNPDSGSSMQSAVAGLVKSNDAVWGQNGAPDAELKGPIELASGSASIKLAKGAIVDISGPTEIQIMGPNKAALKAGVAQIHVPKPAVGFEISVAGARIVDLGTRFSVSSVPSSKYTVVTVTEGKVEAFQPPINRRARERKTRLVAGKTKWFPKKGTERAYDWVLAIDFEFGSAAPEKITIAETEFDLTDFGAASRAKLALKEQFDFAVRQLELVERGERFAGLLIHNDTEQPITNKKQLTTIQSFLTEQISRTNVGPMNPLQMMQEMQQRMKSLLQP